MDCQRSRTVWESKQGFSRRLGVRRLFLGAALADVLRGRTRWEVEEHRRQIIGPREHRIVTRGELDEPPGRARQLAEHGVAGGDHLLHLFEREAAQYPYLGQRFPGRVLQP